MQSYYCRYARLTLRIKTYPRSAVLIIGNSRADLCVSKVLVTFNKGKKINDLHRIMGIFVSHLVQWEGRIIDWEFMFRILCDRGGAVGFGNTDLFKRE